MRERRRHTQKDRERIEGQRERKREAERGIGHALIRA